MDTPYWKIEGGRGENTTWGGAKGKYMMANKVIPPGACILMEPRLLRATSYRIDQFDKDAYWAAGDRSGAPDVYEQYNQLSPEDRQRYDELIFAKKTTDELESEKGSRTTAISMDQWKCLSRCQRNAFDGNVRDDSSGAEPHGGDDMVHLVFYNISYFNHSCKANAVFKWDPATQQGAVRALVEIEHNKEITLNYCPSIDDVLSSKLERRKIMIDGWGFKCQCTPCKRGTEQTWADDNLRAKASRQHARMLGLIWPGHGQSPGLSPSSDGRQATGEAGEEDDADLSDADRVTRTIWMHNQCRKQQACLQFLIDAFKTLGLTDNKLSEVYVQLARHHAESFRLNDGEKSRRHETCGNCGLVTHARANLDLALKAYSEAITLNEICYGADSPEVTKYKNAHEALRKERHKYAAPIPR